MPPPPSAPLPGLGPWRAGAAETSAFVPFPDEAVEGSLIDRLRMIAEQRPESQAVSSPAGSWTYRQLVSDMDRRAAGIVALVSAVEPTPVCVLAGHDGPLVVSILSIIAAGHVVVVLDSQSSDPALTHLLTESGAPVLLHDDENASRAEALVQLPEEPIAAVSFDVADRFVSSSSRTPTPADSDRPAMLAFTSGTSGSPKAAVINHGVLLNLVRGATNALGIGPNDRMPMLFPTSLAVAAYPMFLPLLNGGTLCTLDVRSVGLAPVADFLRDERITLVYMAPTVVRFLVDALSGREFEDLRLVALGGELVDAEVVQLTRSVLGPDLVANGYGTTESGVISLWVIDDEQSVGGVVPTGYPVPDVELFVLDDAGDPLPQGRTGEIAVSSRFMFNGYWGHPELDRQVLTSDPADRPGWRMYRTGDFGQLDEAGALTVTGRLDTKVKVRGKFVVLGDVETRIASLEDVADCAVSATAPGGVTELVAHVVRVTGSDLDGPGLRAQLLETEPAHSVPARWVFLDELPRLPNGKTDRRSLPSPEAVDRRTVVANPGGRTAADIDRDRIRRHLCDIWGRLLPVGTVGPDEDFFHLGGDSLLAAQMLVMVESELGIVVPMGELVHARTVRELAEIAVVVGAETEEDHVVSCVQRGDEATRPRLWFVPDLQGSAYRVRHLAAAIGADQPVWSFESPLLAGVRNPFSSLRSFAAYLLRKLREEQPEGPYWLAGYSFGGICAYEMARQLRERGESVAFVGVVDVGPGYRGPGSDDRRSPGRPWFGVARPPAAGSTATEQARHYFEMTRNSPLGAARHLMVRSGFARLVDPWRFRLDLARRGRVRPEWRLWYAWEEHWKLAATAWARSTRMPGRVHLLWECTTGSDDATMGWGPIVEDLVIHRFEIGPGRNHDDILEPAGAPALAAALRAAMDGELQDRSVDSSPLR